MNYTSSRNCFHIKIHFLNGFIGFIITALTAHLKQRNVGGSGIKTVRLRAPLMWTEGCLVISSGVFLQSGGRNGMV
jgi:hypothetical protein